MNRVLKFLLMVPIINAEEEKNRPRQGADG